ncbi:FAD-dependent oxidoreductase [Bosea sp. (in: a-proteobacteria)]|uniref:FAD-dependent oxidoreductase n=1 Tax=Bosea sp. (in: a-proteobacteria) TaxID=1871050 RepID=UPI002FCBC051
MTAGNSADVIIVGAGIAGASAAIEAATQGARVIGIDAADGFGGTARLAGGGACVPGTTMQKERGVADSPELAFRDLAAGGHDFDRGWAKAYFERANAEVFEWLAGLGIAFPDLRHFEGDSVPRFHRPLDGGAGLMAGLWRHGASLGLDRAWRFGLRMTELIVTDGTVRGIICRNAAGGSEEFLAPAVIVAIGGFAANATMIRRHARWLDRAPRVLAGGGPGAQGEAIAILGRHGVRFGHLGDLYCYATGVPDYRDPSGERGVVLRGATGWLWLNRDGGRFHDESQATSGNVAVPRLLEQPQATGWAIFDDAMLAAVTVDDHHVPPGSETGNEAARRHLAHSAHAWQAPSLEELWQRAGIAPEGAAATIAAWHTLLASGQSRDPATGRPLAGLQALRVPPFHAVQFFPIGRKAMGGVQTDRTCRALTGDGSCLPGLYAAGETAGMAGGHIAGLRPLEGMMVGPSCFSGRIAGAMAADFARGSAGRATGQAAT